MVELASYNEAIVHTLRSSAIRSAILIDDSFPRYDDLAQHTGNPSAIRAQFEDFDAALALYRFLNEQKILCDVENAVNHLDATFIEKIRKSDLVILDWNLTKGDDLDHEIANRVLSGLADSPQFNLVVVYTRQTNLADVWIAAAGHLKGGWKTRTEFLEGKELPDNHDEILAALEANDTLDEQITTVIKAAYMVGGIKKAKSHIGEIARDIEAAGCPKPFLKVYFEAIIHGVMRSAQTGAPDNAVRTVEGDPLGDHPFLLCGSVFVAFKTKPKAGEDPPETILETLDQALIRWKPNLIQLLVSELQNELELNSYAFNAQLLPSDARKAAWIYHTLHELKQGEILQRQEEDVLDDVLAALNGRLIEALQSNIDVLMVDDQCSLVQYGRQTTRLALQDQVRNREDKELVTDAIRIAGVSGLQPVDVLHALNEYLSSDKFSGKHITTGTVLCDADKAVWYLCVSPACDMVPRKSGDDLSWHNEIYPMRPVNMLRLEKTAPGTALANAEHGVQVFTTVDGESHYLRAIDGTTRLPRPSTLFITDGAENIVGQESWQTHGFTLKHVQPDQDDLAARTFFAVSQLRPGYSARYLGLSGTHQSRVGVDYVRFGTPSVEAG